MNALSPMFYYLLLILFAIAMIQHYKLPKERITMLFFLPPILFVFLGECYYVFILAEKESFDFMAFGALLLVYIMFLAPLLIVSILFVSIQKRYAPNLPKQLFIVSFISSIIMGIFLYFIDKPVLYALLASVVYMITVTLLYYLTDVKKVIY